MPQINYKPSETIMLTPTEVTELVLAPSIELSSPLTNSLGIFKIYPNAKNGIKLAILKSASTIIRAPKSCEWNPVLASQWDSKKWTLCSHQAKVELCKEQLENCYANWEASGVNRHNPLAGEFSPVTLAYINLIVQNLRNDIAKMIWFLDSDFATSEYMWRNDLENAMDISNLKMLTETLKRDDCNGFFAVLANMSSDKALLPIINTVSKTADATKSSDVEAFFDLMINASPSHMRAMRSLPLNQRPALLVQPDIFEAYWSALRGYNVADSTSVQYITNGSPLEGVLLYKGYPVISMYEWEHFDEIIGAKKAGKKSMNQRALFVPRGADANLALLHNAADLQEGTGFVVESSDSIKDSFKTYIQADFNLGVGIANSEMIVFAANIGVDSLDPNEN